MIQKKWQSLALKSGALVALLAAMVLSYQNCGKAGFDQTDIASELGTTQIDAKLANLPFPYEVTVNQAAFMSCQFRGTDPSANTPYFSFQVGAFDNDAGSPTYALYQSKAGLGVRQEFVDEFNRVGGAFNPSYRPTKYKEALTALPSVQNTRLQLSLRPRNFPQNILLKYPSIGNFGGGEMPATSFMASITSDAVAETFKAYMEASSQPKYNFFQTAPAFADRPLEAKLLVPWGSYDGGIDYYGPLISAYSNSYLTVGFAKDDRNLASASTDGVYAYGKGLKPDFIYNYNTPIFGAPVGGVNSMNHIVLSGFSEYDLATGYSSGATWRCSDSGMKLMAFKIVKDVDRFLKIYRRNNFSWPNTSATGVGQTPNGTCPGVRYQGQYCPSPDNPKVFGRPLTEFPSGSGGYVCPQNRRGLLPASNVTSGNPADGTQLTSGTFHAYGTFCEEQYEYACPAEPLYQPSTQIPGQPPLSENAYLASSPEKLAIYYALRRFLPESQWDINVSKRCIVEKTRQDNVCYASGNRPVVYDEYFFPPAGAAGRDTADPAAGRHTGCGPGLFGDCPAYLTLCVRQ